MKVIEVFASDGTSLALREDQIDATFIVEGRFSFNSLFFNDLYEELSQPYQSDKKEGFLIPFLYFSKKLDDNLLKSVKTVQWQYGKISITKPKSFPSVKIYVVLHKDTSKKSVIKSYADLVSEKIQSLEDRLLKVENQLGVKV